MLSAPRKTASLEGRRIVLPLAADVTIYPGAMVAITAAGAGTPAEKEEDQPAVGCAVAVDESTVTVQRGTHLWDNDTTAPVTQAHVGKNCYILDDATVTATATGSSVAGKVLGFEGGQVAVETL